MVDLLHLGASSLSCRQHVVQFLQHSSNASVIVVMKLNVFLSASLYFSKRGAY